MERKELEEKEQEKGKKSAINCGGGQMDRPLRTGKSVDGNRKEKSLG